MRKELNILICLIFVVGTTWSCDNQIDLLEPGEPEPIVIGMINAGDSVVQIRLSKSFDGSEYPEIDARSTDSLYFSEADVQLELRASDGKVVERTQLHKSQIDPRETGIFGESPNYIYSGVSSARIQGDETGFYGYFLSIYIPEINQSVFSTAQVPGVPSLGASFANRGKINVFNYIYKPEEIRTRRSELFLSLLELVFIYDEQIDEDWVEEQIVYSREYAPDEYLSEFTEVFTLHPDWLYAFISNRIKNNDQVNARRFNKMEVVFAQVSPAYQYYKKTLEFSPDFYSNTFSNIINGKGIFIAKNQTEISDVQFGDEMMDSLVSGQYTKHLKFRRW